MAAQLTVSQILTEAAEILNVQGWTQQGVYEHTRGLQPEECPLDLGAALAKAAGIDIHSAAATDPRGVHARAVMTLARHVLGIEESAWGSLSALADWQDMPGRTAEQVIKKLRSAAVQTPCPPWCETDHPALPNHIRHVGEYGPVTVRVFAWSHLPDEPPKIAVQNNRRAAGSEPGELVTDLELEQAAPFAALLETLGHREIASLIRDAAEEIEHALNDENTPVGGAL